VHNAHVTAREWGTRWFFCQGGTGPADRAYGISCMPNLAGVPKEVVARAEVLLHALEQDAARVSLRQAEQLPLVWPRSRRRVCARGI